MDWETNRPISNIFGTNVRWVHETVYHKFHQNPYDHFAAFAFLCSTVLSGKNRAQQNENNFANY